MQQVPNGKLLANRYHLYTYIGQPAFVFDESDPSVHLLPLNSSINLLERVRQNRNRSVQVVMSVIEPLVWWIFVRDQSYTYFTRHSFVSKEFEAAQGCQPPQQIRHSILLIARDSSGCTKPNPKVLRLHYARPKIPFRCDRAGINSQPSASKFLASAIVLPKRFPGDRWWVSNREPTCDTAT